MNKSWNGPLTETRGGGGKNASARPAQLGLQMLTHYRAVEQGMVIAKA